MELKFYAKVNYVDEKYNLSDYDWSFYDDENRKAISDVLTSKTIPEETHFIFGNNEDGLHELFFDSQFLKLDLATNKIIEDLITDNSSANRYFSLNSNEEKVEFFLEMLKTIMGDIVYAPVFSVMTGTNYLVFFGQMDMDEMGVLAGEYGDVPGFVIELSDDVVKKYYPKPVNYLGTSKDLRQFFDFSLMDKEDMKKLVMPYYYYDWADKGVIHWKKVSEDKEFRDYLTMNCIQTFFGAIE